MSKISVFEREISSIFSKVSKDVRNEVKKHHIPTFMPVSQATGDMLNGIQVSNPSVKPWFSPIKF